MGTWWSIVNRGVLVTSALQVVRGRPVYICSMLARVWAILEQSGSEGEARGE